MATAPTASIQWIPEDDLLLKNAVEVILFGDFDLTICYFTYNLSSYMFFWYSYPCEFCVLIFYLVSFCLFGCSNWWRFVFDNGLILKCLNYFGCRVIMRQFNVCCGGNFYMIYRIVCFEHVYCLQKLIFLKFQCFKVVLYKDLNPFSFTLNNIKVNLIDSGHVSYKWKGLLFP